MLYSAGTLNLGLSTFYGGCRINGAPKRAAMSTFKNYMSKVAEIAEFEPCGDCKCEDYMAFVKHCEFFCFVAKQTARVAAKSWAPFAPAFQKKN